MERKWRTTERTISFDCRLGGHLLVIHLHRRSIGARRMWKEVEEEAEEEVGEDWWLRRMKRRQR